MGSRLAIGWTLLLVLPAAALCRSEGATVPNDATLEANEAVIGDVIVRAGNIFDPEKPGEDRAVFRLANRLHRETRESVIRRELLFEPGDRYSVRVLAESERILRAAGYLYDAKIRPIRYENNRVDVEVSTRDVWTLRGGVGFGRSGGANSTRFGLADRNFLGTGKDVAVRRTSTVDRTQTLYRYRDPNLLGTRGRLHVSYSDNSDGRHALIDVQRPFYALSTRWAAGIIATTNDRIDALYDLGAITSQFRHDSRGIEAFVGVSHGVLRGSARRFNFGFTYQQDHFDVARGLASPAAIPPARTLSYPWVGFDLVQDGFITAHDLDRLQRTEDLNLGHEVQARLGFASTALGSDADRAIYELSYASGSSPGNGQMLFISAKTSGRFGGAGPENLRVGGALRYYVRDLGDNVFFASLRGDFARRMDTEEQLLLGGDSGLRGYPLRYMNGDRRILLTLEQRFYTDWHVMKLFHVGGAVFFDAGRAWFGKEPNAGNLAYLKDVGFGLRVGSSRSAHGALVHIDLAFPLNAPRGAPRVQFLVSTGETF